MTLHDMAVRSILRGGVHYRDVFDTNLPGIDWAMAGVRRAFGWGYEVCARVDLVVIGGRGRGCCSCGCGGPAGPGTRVAWLAAAAAMFYPFTSEFNHVQRDPWMLLPAVVAARLRLRPGASEPARSASRRSVRCSKGFVWGVAVWVKPHVVVPAVAVWVVSAVLIARRESGRPCSATSRACSLGGLLAGAAGRRVARRHRRVAALPRRVPELEPGLHRPTCRRRGHAVRYRPFYCFRPWSLLHFVALPLALLALLGSPRAARGPDRATPARRWSTPPPRANGRGARALLAALYLGWLRQAVSSRRGSTTSRCR